MHFGGILAGLAVFFIIGIFHPIVIKCEYYFSYKIWKLFLQVGMIFLLVSVFAQNDILSMLSGVLGFTCFWSIKELHEQRERVRKGWYPKNPNRKGEQ